MLVGAVDLWLTIDKFINGKYGACAFYAMVTLYMITYMVIYTVKAMFNLR
jgi:hypothetical protein